MRNYTASRQMGSWTQLLNSPEPGSVRRAESAGNGPLYNGAVSMNVPTQSSSINDIARLFAGLDGQGLSQVRSSPAWAAHRLRMDNLWATHQKLHRDPLLTWAGAEIGDVQRANALFYPFSGPDFLFASAICPAAETYVLCGLEPAEPLPRLADLSQAEIESGLYGLHNSVSTIMTSSYFITTEMRSNLQATLALLEAARAAGTQPLLVFASSLMFPGFFGGEGGITGNRVAEVVACVLREMADDLIKPPGERSDS